MYRFAIPILALFGCAVVASAQPDPPAAPKAPFPVLPDGDAWDKLPPPKKPALPEWARTLAGPMPKTTAKLLELDYLHRAKNPLGPELSALLRREVAKALFCKCGEAVAQADYERARPFSHDRPREGGGLGRVDPETHRQLVAIKFARKLTLEGHAITDEEFREVLKHFGPTETTAIVHTVAYANFHNRVLLALGVKGESPVAEPIGLAFDTDNLKQKAPDRPPWDDLKAAKGDGLAVRVDWSDANHDRLNATLDKQKERSLRVPLPDKSVYEKLTPREQESAKKILWNTVSMGYQPELTRAWFGALYAFYEEAKPDRVFTNSMFWVVTRTNDCFY